MASASGSSASRCSSSSFHHSSRYSTSTVRSSSADSLQPRLHSRFGEETSIRSITDDLEPEQESFARYHGDQQSFGGYSEDQKYTGGGFHGNWSLGDTGMQVSGSRRSASTGVVRAMGDSYFLSADVSGFEPQEVVVLAYNQCVVIQAEKSEAAGSVAGRFTQKSVLPEDMDPLSVSSALTSEGILTIRVSRTPKQPGEPGTPVFCSEAHF
ncbi:small heat shock protein Hspb12 [Triplophysa rosa]|uniref:Small heat shock protein Hspb12 n=1 Tax=Triplophysa rosa TaxID=992332 RepID=A0A9W7WKE1_TRIRA|nr:small heat shock protein Hspb12 [Triplophysa rosa]